MTVSSCRGGGGKKQRNNTSAFCSQVAEQLVSLIECFHVNTHSKWQRSCDERWAPGLRMNNAASFNRITSGLAYLAAYLHRSLYFFSLSLSVSHGNSSIAPENLISQMFFFKSPLKLAFKMKQEMYQHYFSHFVFLWCSELWTSSRAKTKETHIKQQLNGDRFFILHTVYHCTNLFPCQTIEELKKNVIA